MGSRRASSVVIDAFIPSDPVDLSAGNPVTLHTGRCTLRGAYLNGVLDGDVWISDDGQQKFKISADTAPGVFVAFGDCEFEVSLDVEPAGEESAQLTIVYNPILPLVGR